MPIFIYNTLTRKKEELKPIKPGHISMYVCGPTVYDEPHIGHARSAYIFDVIRCYLEYKGYSVKFVRNVTDVDDKIIDKARAACPGKESLKASADGNLKTTVKEISQRYLDAYRQDMELLGMGKPDYEPKATEYIQKMIKFIEVLIKRGMAYESEGDVYFDIKKTKDYGKLSGQSIDKMEIGARITPGENKKDALDFALWKKAKEDEPSWPSPWGEGRPGWHIECSVMSSDMLGDEFDIHGGGLDLIFPHHENEIAQSEGLGKKFAKYWLHNGLLTINGEKMAKSLGNFITIKDVLAKYPADVLKLCYLTVHYANPLDFSWERMDAAKEELERIRECIRRINEDINLRKKYQNRIQLTPVVTYADFKKKIDDLKTEFEAAMDDDFNAPRAKSVIFEIVYEFYVNNTMLENTKCLQYVRKAIFDLGMVFGLNLDKIDSEEMDSQLKAAIKERDAARKAKDFKKADSIRKELEAKGIILEDTKEGTVWRRKI